MKNRVKKMLQAGEAALGAWMTTGCPEAIWALADSGIDWTLFDLEHGPCEIETVNSLIYYMRGAKAIPIIRVVWNDINAIKRALDTGAYGVVVPWVSSRKEAVNAVRFCRYPPEGIRGAAPGRPSKVWGMSKEEYLWNANEEIIIIVQIEREEAVNNIEEILSVEGIDATFIGPTDLSNSLGFTGEPFHPEVVKAIEKVLDACKDAGVAPGIAYTQNSEHTRELIDKGFQLVGIGSDVGFLQKGCEAAIEAIKQGKN